MGIETKMSDLRRDNLRSWIDKHCDSSQAKFIDQTDINQGELSGLLRDKSFGEKKARSLEEKAKMPTFWLDKSHNSLMPPNSYEVDIKKIA